MSAAVPGVTKKRARYRAVDMWRGLAALWVVTIHACIYALEQYYPGFVGKHEWFFHCYLGVQVLFVISGFSIATSAGGILTRGDGLGKFWKDRFQRIFPPYYAAALLTIASSLTVAALVKFGILRGSQLANLGFFERDWKFYLGALSLLSLPIGREPVIIFYWTLSYEIAFYIVMSAFLWKWRGKQVVSERFMLNVSHGVTLIVSAGLLFRGFLPFPFDWWIFFGMGILVYDLLNHHEAKLPRVAFGLTAAALLIHELFVKSAGGVAVTVSHSEGSHDPNRLIGLTFACLLLFLYRFDEKLAGWKVAGPFIQTSRFSYSLFLLHALTLGVTLQAARLLKLPAATWPLLVIAMVVVSILVAIVFDRIMNRYFGDKKRGAPAVRPSKAARGEMPAAAPSAAK